MKFFNHVFAHHGHAAAVNARALRYKTPKPLDLRSPGEHFLAFLKNSMSFLVASVKTSSHSCAEDVANDEASVVRSRTARLIKETGLIDMTVLNDFRDNGLLSKFPRYLGTVSERITHLETLVAQSNFDEVKKVLHAMIGPTGMMGAVALCSYIVELDKPAKREAAWAQDPYWLTTIKRLHVMTAETMQPHLDS